MSLYYNIMVIQNFLTISSIANDLTAIICYHTVFIFFNGGKPFGSAIWDL